MQNKNFKIKNKNSKKFKKKIPVDGKPKIKRAFLIPILENLYLKKWTRLDGVGAIIISPTRELAYQIFETLKKVGAHHDFSSGLIIGGKNLKFEKTRMDQCNIVICTPGRLLQHMDENPLFNCISMQILVLDEADRCLDMGFADTMNAIIDNLPPDRQTLLFSATQTKSVKDLARLSLKSPEYIAPHDKADTRTPATLQQNYVVVNQEDKMTMLWSFIKSHLKQKSIVFMSSCKQVKYIYEIFSKLRPGVSLLALYGTLHQDRRMAIYDEFCKRSKVVLFATDIASRGLDFPIVSWVIQLDCPEDVNAYIHRAGRTARHKAQGESLLVLTPNEETSMVEELKSNKIPINQISIDPKRLFSPQVKMEAFVAQSNELKESAQRAFVAYIKSVYLMKNKKIFNVESINFDEYARSLGLVVTPRVRFLQRLKKRKEKNEIEEKSDDDIDSAGDESNQKEKLKSIDLNALMAEESDEDDDFVTIKRKDHEIVEFDSETIVEDIKEARKSKILTKAALAKKIIKKKIVPNKKIQYDEEGKEIINTAKQLQSELAREYEENDDDDGGINIEKAKELLEEEDKFDKQRYKEKVKLKHREKKNKLKKLRTKESGKDDDDDEEEFDSESAEEPDVSWLPDYDEINRKQAEMSDEEGDQDSESSDDQIHRPPTKLYEKKRSAEEESSEEEIHLKKKSRKDIASKLTLNDAEALAMSLISK
ncbi:CLUMA_CG019043, isoform A [Clunio marinus]|uniref:ATP-dependent RNA helicase n=1 Tax=Clunio marinus TaxID=568069 RepID=A0A1J1J1F5_9DIPT|nr:CLUMA_CG019043, isoform A [Clunio marinus]